MYEEFADDARDVLDMAEREAHRLKSGYFGTEHLLQGIIKLATNEARDELNRSDALTEILRDVPLTAIQQQMERVLIPAPPLVQQRSWIFWRKPKIVLPKTPRLRKALENAMEEAQFWHQRQVGSVHLLLGLLRDDDNVAATMLANFGLEYWQARRTAVRLFQSD